MMPANSGTSLRSIGLTTEESMPQSLKKKTLHECSFYICFLFTSSVSRAYVWVKVHTLDACQLLATRPLRVSKVA